MTKEITLLPQEQAILDVAGHDIQAVLKDDWNRFRLGFILACRKPIPKTNLKVYQCSTNSLIECFIKFANLGLTPGDSFGEGFIIPRAYQGYDENKNPITKYQATFMPGVRGLEKLVHKNYDNVVSGAVFKNDKFTPPHTSLSGKTLNHEVVSGERGEFIGAFAMVYKVVQGVVFTDCEYMDCNYLWQAVKKGNMNGKKVPLPGMLTYDEKLFKQGGAYSHLYYSRYIYEKGFADYHDLEALGKAWSDYFFQMARNRVVASMATRLNLDAEIRTQIQDAVYNNQNESPKLVQDKHGGEVV